MNRFTSLQLAPYIDHTLLQPAATTAAIVQICEEALENQFAAVCIPPYYVSIAAETLKDTPVKVATVIDFPLGYSATASKLAAIKKALVDGADEIDIVQNLAAVKNKDWTYISNEIAACLQPIRLHNKVIKVILETALLTEEELIHCCEIYAQRKVDFVKTSTGFAGEGATTKVVELMRKYLPDTIGIKASGGIRTFEFAKELIEAGATRIGTSAGVQLMKATTS